MSERAMDTSDRDMFLYIPACAQTKKNLFVLSITLSPNSSTALNIPFSCSRKIWFHIRF